MTSVFKQYGRTRKGFPKFAYCGKVSKDASGAFVFKPYHMYATYWDTHNAFNQVAEMRLISLDCLKAKLGGNVEFRP
jgi:hypothetical protein